MSSEEDEVEVEPMRKRFRFKGFAERLKEVNVDVVHRIREVQPSVETENSSKLAECLVKWRSLDLTSQFKSFHRSVVRKCRSYKMIVYYQNDIVKSLVHSLKEEDTLALQSLLEILVALSADLGPDFYPSFSTFFPILVKLLKTRDTEKLEWVFVAISLLFRNLWRYMINDMENVLELYKKLLISDQPSHIASFAAESVSFLLRKTKDHKLVLRKLFTIVQEHPKAVDSIGKVLFEMFKTSQSQFHSATASILPIMLQFVSEPYSEEPFFPYACKSIEVTLRLMATHTTKQYATPVWNIIMQEIQHSTKTLRDLTYTVNLINILNVWCETQKGSKLVNDESLVNAFYCCVALLEGETSEKSSTLYSFLCKLASTMIIAQKIELTVDIKQKILSSVVSNVMNLECCVQLWKSLIKRPEFFSLYLKIFLTFCQDQIQVKEYQPAIIKLIVSVTLINHSLPQDNSEVERFNPHSLDFSFASAKSLLNPGDVVKDIISKSSDWPFVWYCLVATFSFKQVNIKLKSSLCTLMHKIMMPQKQSNEKLAVLSMSFLLAYKLYGNKIPKKFDTEKYFLLLLKNHSSKHLLFILDIIVANKANAFDGIADEDRNKLSSLLEENVSASDAVLRRLTLSVLQYIDEANSSIYQACLQAEDIPATISGVRDKILKLSKLQTFKDAEFSDQAKRILLSFLFSNFFINFTPLWQPVQEILCSYSATKDNIIFWNILFQRLEDSPSLGAGEVKSLKTKCQTTLDNSLFHAVLQGYTKHKSYASNERINYGNYRLLLWKTLVMLPNVNALQSRSKPLVDLFLQFLKNEFFQVDKHLASWEEMKNDENVTVKDDLGTIKKSDTMNLLNIMLKVFGRFSNLNRFPQSDYLMRLFKDFVSHPDSNVQMLAFHCLLGYKDPTLVKYKEALQSFIDEKKFRHAVVDFDVSALSDDDRPIIMSVLLQILFGKMKSKEKMHSAGKAVPDTRRSLVVRFLCNVSNDEMSQFAQLLWRPYSTYLDSLGLSKTFDFDLLKTESIVKLIPMRKQHGIINCIHMLIEECNQQLTLDTFSTLITLLLRINVVNKVVMDKQVVQDPSRVSKVFHALQGVKRQSLECILDMLKVYPSYLVKENVDALFSVHIWPDLPKLLHESSGKPNLLLKMLFMFAQNPAYLPLLAKCNPSSTSDEGFDCSSPLAAITSLLTSSKCSPDVTSFCVELLLSMLYGQVQETEENGDVSSASTEDFSLASNALAMCGTMSVVIKPEDFQSRLQFGLAMLMPHLSKIVNYYISKMKRNRKGFLLPKRDLKFLSSVGDIVNDDAFLSDLTELLLGHINAAGTSHSADGNELFVLSLRSLARVMRNTKHIVQISKLFSKLSEREHRLALVSILQRACQREPDFAWTCEVVSGLNTWEKTSLDQMDYDAKLLAFRNVSDRLKGDDYDSIFDRNCELVLPILHCCLHTLHTNYEDISLRESVHFVLELTIQRVGDLFSLDFDYAYIAYQILIQQLILPSIESGLNSAVDDMRHDSIKLLSKVVAHFPNEPTLVGLDVLRNEKNINDDTFDNLRHIQVHRRANAFRKVAALLKKQHFPLASASQPEANDANDEKSEISTDSKSKKIIIGRIISSNTARRYLLPLALQNLWNHRFKHIPYLREACIEVVKICALIMPWSVYRKMLVRTITGIKFPITSFLVICSLLEIFPYDLSNFKWHDSKTTSAERTLSHDLMVKKDKKGNQEVINQEEILARNKLSAKEADAVLSDVERVILPNLFSILSVKDIKNPKQSKPDITYRSCERRLPYAKPIVLLLKKLPESVIKTSLPTVVLNVFAFLKHKEYEVRKAASKASVSILLLLGPSYFALMLKQLKATLCRGFQCHVLLHTVHVLLKCLSSSKVGMFDEALPVLLEIVNDGLFGTIADEKTTLKVKEKLPEAVGNNKAYSIYLKIATFVRKSDMSTLIDPLKNKLQQTQSHEETKAVIHALNRITEGLLTNADFEAKDLLIFVHGLIIENISCVSSEKGGEAEKEKKIEFVKPESCYILPATPKRVGERTVAKSSSTNLHILVEFALNLLLGLMKNVDNLSAKQEYLEMLDPLVPYITQCLSSTHSRTLGSAVDCVTHLFRAKLPSMSSHAKTIVENLFKIAKDNSKGMGNQTQALACFKGLRVLCQSDYGKHISNTQLKILLAYAAEDLYVSERQVQSFTLIKSIMIRGLQCEELVEVIDKVRSIAIQSQIKFMQQQARMIYIYFLKNYPMFPEEIDNHIEFILTQLSYEYEGGRMSALQLVSTVVTTFPEELLDRNAAVLFVPVAAVIVNDDSATCRESAAAVIRFLLPRLKQKTIDELMLTFSLQW